MAPVVQPTQEQSNGVRIRHRSAAFALRVLGMLLPLLIGIAAAVAANASLPRPNRAVMAIGRGVVIVVASTLAITQFDSFIGRTRARSHRKAISGAAPAVVAGVMSMAAVMAAGGMAPVGKTIVDREQPSVVAAALFLPAGATLRPNIDVAAQLPPTTQSVVMLSTTTSVVGNPSAEPPQPASTTTAAAPPETSSGASATTVPPATLPATTRPAEPTTTTPPTTTLPPATTRSTTTVAPTTAEPPLVSLLMSSSPNRSDPSPLAGNTVSRGSNVYIFARSTGPTSAIERVEFYNGTNTSGAPYRIDTDPEYDYNGTTGNGKAIPAQFSTTGISNITVRVKYDDGRNVTVTARFTVPV